MPSSGIWRCGYLLLTVVLLFLSLAAPVAAQVGTILDKSKLPACAFSCQLLLSAQTLCVPPTAPAQGQAIYQSCFCNSNYLVPFKAGSPNGVCDSECPSTADRSKIQNWYAGLCNGGAVVTPNNGGTTVKGTASSAASTATSSSSSSSSEDTSRPTWISEHYRWIIMVIVLFFLALGGIFLGLWWKRRHNRKYNYARDPILAAEDAKNTLRDKHPETPSSMSRVNPPAWDNSVLMSGAAGTRSRDRGHDGIVEATTRKKEKSKFTPNVEAKELDDRVDEAEPQNLGEPVGPSDSAESSGESRRKKRSRRSKR